MTKEIETDVVDSGNKPLMEINLNKPDKEIVSPDQLLSLYDKILKNLDEDRVQIDGIFGDVVNMVMNDGDASSATKEAMVNLLKLKIDASDKMARVADLMTRVVLRDRDTVPGYMLANQNNTIKIESGSKRNLLKNINKALEEANNKNSGK